MAAVQNRVNIKGVDKVTLLKALWSAAKPTAFFQCSALDDSGI